MEELHEKNWQPAAVAASFLFGPGERPDRGSIFALAHSCSDFAVSFDPAQRKASSQTSMVDLLRPAEPAADWLELTRLGLSFDLIGLAPGPDDPCPFYRHKFGLAEDFDAVCLQTLTLRPSPHLAAAQGNLFIIGALASLAAKLCTLPGLRSVIWQPGNCCHAPRHFTGAVRQFEEGGFPDTGLIGIAQMVDCGLVSEGLALFIGQEVRLEPDCCEDRAEARSLVRGLAAHLFNTGELALPSRWEDDTGVSWRLEPSANRRFVRMRPA